MSTNTSSPQTAEVLIERLVALLTTRRVLFSLFIILSFVAWNRGIALIYGLCFFLLAVLLISYIVSIVVIAPIIVSRSHPAIAREGEPITFTYHVTNQSRFSRYLLEIIDALPFAQHSQQSPMLFVPAITQSTDVSLSITADWRGEHTLGPLRVESGWPFGLFYGKRSLPNSHSDILIYPSTFSISQLPLQGTSFFQHDGWMSDRRKGGQDLFLGLRDYRHGDGLKHIHWPLSAKRGELMVKEYENISRTEVCILLDLHAANNPGKGKHTPLEYAIKIAASVAEFSLKEGFFVSVYGAGEQPLEIDAGSGLAWLDKILYSLALVKANGTERYETLIQREIARRTNRCAFLLFDHEGFSLQQRALGIPSEHIMMVRFDKKTFSQMLSSINAEPRDGSLVIRCGDDVSERVQSWSNAR